MVFSKDGNYLHSLLTCVLIAEHLIPHRHNVCPLVVGVGQSCYRRYASKAAADAGYADAERNGLVAVL